jgi:hypothetical protein
MQVKEKGEEGVNRIEINSKRETKRTNRWRGDRTMEEKGRKRREEKGDEANVKYNPTTFLKRYM